MATKVTKSRTCRVIFKDSSGDVTTTFNIPYAASTIDYYVVKDFEDEAIADSIFVNKGVVMTAAKDQYLIEQTKTEYTAD